MKNKLGFLDMSFGWLFALVVGGFILFMAIFFIVKYSQTEQTSSNVQLSKELGVLLNPTETGLETSRVTLFELPAETKIYNECYEAGNFGRQIIRTSQESFGKFQENYIDVAFQNKYVFSENPVEGKKFYVFSKPFEFPFKVSDLIYITSTDKEYCFVNAPKEINEELNSLKQENFLNVTMVDNCPKESEKVCFSSSQESGCDTIVRMGTKIVNKQGKSVNFEGNVLMYAAIFSSPEIYECQVKRLMKRMSELAGIYDGKASIVSVKNCNVNWGLINLESSAKSYSTSSDLSQINLLVEDIGRRNDIALCKLW